MKEVLTIRGCCVTNAWSPRHLHRKLLLTLLYIDALITRCAWFIHTHTHRRWNISCTHVFVWTLLPRFEEFPLCTWAGFWNWSCRFDFTHNRCNNVQPTHPVPLHWCPWMASLLHAYGQVVRIGVSVTWNALSWSGSHEFKPWSGWTWGA